MISLNIHYVTSWQVTEVVYMENSEIWVTKILVTCEDKGEFRQGHGTTEITLFSKLKMPVGLPYDVFSGKKKEEDS